MAPKIPEKKRKAVAKVEDAESDDGSDLDNLLNATLSDSDDSDEAYDDVSDEGSSDFEGLDDEDEDEDDEDDELNSDDVPSKGDADESDELAKLTLSNGMGAEDEEGEEEEEEDRPNYRVTTDANGGVRYIYDEVDPVYDSDDSAQETANTIGNIPLSFYDSYPHIGYDINGKKIMRPATREALDALLDSIEVPKDWTGLTDPATGKPLKLSKDELELLRRVQMNEIPEEGYDPYPDTVEYFTSIEEKMPLSAAPEPKRRFVPSKHEGVRIAKLARAIREGRILPYKPPEEVEREREAADEIQHYDLWQDEQPQEPHVMHIPAPKLPPPGHSESYNCPPEYVPTKAERAAWEATDPEEREQAFLPAKYDALRKVPGYASFVKERFERCLDLYLAPRVRRNRLNIDPSALLPKLPPAEELKPFPTVCQTIFRGHAGWVRTVAIDPTGCWLASGGDDGTVRLWELLTGRQVWSARLSAGRTSRDEHNNEPVTCVAWRPARTSSSSSSEVCSVLAAAAGETVSLIVPLALVNADVETTSRAVVDAGFGYAAVAKKPTDGSNGSSGSSSDTKAPVAKWARPEDPRLTAAGVLVQVRVRAPVTSLSWHRRGEHFVTVAPAGGRQAVVIHTLAQHRSQAPAYFRRLGTAGPVAARFHPARPQLFVATRQRIRVFDLQKAQVVATILPGARAISSFDIHPGVGSNTESSTGTNAGENLAVGSYDRRLVWHDLGRAGNTPFRTMRYHERAVRAVRFHRGGLPLLADTSDDGSLQIYFGRVYQDALEAPTIVPLKKLDRGAHRVVDAVGALDVCWHPKEAWCVSAGADGTCRLWM